MQSSLVMNAIARYGSEAQKTHYLPRLARGELIGCFGLTESQGGSDPSDMRTRAEADGDLWRISGSKHWITNGGIADVVVLWAVTRSGITAFLIERGAEGLEQRSISGKLSLRASNTGDLHLSDVVVGDDRRLPSAQGLKAALSCLDEARYGIAWGAVGAARECLREALDYVSDRQLFGSSLAAKQMVQERLADAARRIVSASLVAYRIADLKMADRSTPEQVSLAKWNNVRAALDVARTCRDILGAAGITTDHHAMRHALNMESVVTYEGTESIHMLAVGRALTGVSAF